MLAANLKKGLLDSFWKPQGQSPLCVHITRTVTAVVLPPMLRVALEEFEFTSTDLEGMLKMSTPYELGYRRFKDIIFELSQGEVVGITRDTSYLKSKAESRRTGNRDTIAQGYPKELDETVALGVPYFNCETCKDTGEVLVFNECPSCEGSGCHDCKDTGQKTAKISCQQCSLASTLKSKKRK